MQRLNLVGALLGWKRYQRENGMVITLQVLTPEPDSKDRQRLEVSLALNDRQIRSLARDLQRAAFERGMTLWAKPKWWWMLLG